MHRQKPLCSPLLYVEGGGLSFRIFSYNGEYSNAYLGKYLDFLCAKARLSPVIMDIYFCGLIVIVR